MRHLVWLLHDLVYKFDFYMGWYYTLPVMVSLVFVGGLLSFLKRSRKPVLLSAAAVVALYGVFALSSWSNLEWKLYCYGMYGQFHLPSR